MNLDRQQHSTPQPPSGDAPSWLARLTDDARQRLPGLAPPSPRSEGWRLSDLAAFLPDQFAAPPATPGAGAVPSGQRVDELLALVGVASGGRLVQVDGHPHLATTATMTRGGGVTFCDLARAAREHPELVRPHLGSLVPGEAFFEAHALAGLSGGALVHVPAGTRLALPLQTLSWTSARGAATYLRSLVVLERGAELTLVDYYASDDLDAPALVSPTTELLLGEGARLRWLSVQRLGRGARFLGHFRARLARDASLESMVVTLGADHARTSLEVGLAGPGADARLMGLSYPGQGQRVEHWTVQDHIAPNTSSDLAYRGAHAGNGRSVYNGTIRVAPGARGTDAYQQNRNLLLSNEAHAHTNPQLEIENDEVRCTHGATVGPLQQEHVFYLMSRGIPRAEAEQMLVQGFFGALLDRVGWSGATAPLVEAVRRKTAASATTPGTPEPEEVA